MPAGLHRDRARSPNIENLRSALRHSLSSIGDLDVAIGLAAFAVPVWTGQSLLDECRGWLEAVRAKMTPEQRASTEGWAIDIAVRNPRMLTQGVSREDFENWLPPPAGPVFNYVVKETSISHILSQWVWNLRQANYVESVRLAREHDNIVGTSGELYDRVMSTWIMAQNMFHLGELTDARKHLSHFLSTEEVSHRRMFHGRTGQDRRPGTVAMLATTLCLLGETQVADDQATIAEYTARAVGTAALVCETLAWTSAARLIEGRPVSEIEPNLTEMIAISRLFSLGGYLGVAIGLLGICRIVQQDFDPAVALLDEAVSTLARCNYGPFVPWFVGGQAYALARVGRPDDAKVILNGFNAGKPFRTCWCAPEMMRYEALVLASAGAERYEIEDVLNRGEALVRSQKSVAWGAALTVTRAGLLGPDDDSVRSESIDRLL